MNSNTSANYTSTTAYCKYTGIKVSIGTEFHNTVLRNTMLATVHPIFAAKEGTILKAIVDSVRSKQPPTPTEQHLLCIAYLHKAGYIYSTPATEHKPCPIILDWSTSKAPKLWRAFLRLVQVRTEYTANHKEIANRVQLNPFQEITIPDLQAFIVEATSQYTVYSSMPRTTKSDNRLDDDIALEREVRSILDHFDKQITKNKYSGAVGKWCIRTLEEDPSISTEQVAQVKYALFQDNIDRISVDLLESSMRLLKDVLPMDSMCRINSTLCVRYLAAKLERLNVYASNFGFVILEEEDITIGDVESGEHVAFKARTKVKTTIKVEHKKPNKVEGAEGSTYTAPANSALARLLAKRKGTA